MNCATENISELMLNFLGMIMLLCLCKRILKRLMLSYLGIKHMLFPTYFQKIWEQKCRCKYKRREKANVPKCL